MLRRHEEVTDNKLCCSLHLRQKVLGGEDERITSRTRGLRSVGPFAGTVSEVG